MRGKECICFTVIIIADLLRVGLVVIRNNPEVMKTAMSFRVIKSGKGQWRGGQDV